MVTKVFSKPQTQQVIKDMRSAGYTVDKLDGGYECKLYGNLIFKAMIGNRGYLIRYDAQLLTAA